MKAYFILALLIILAESVNSVALDNYNVNSYLIIDISISSNITSSFDGSSDLKYLRANLSLMPRPYFLQEIQALEAYSKPSALVNKNTENILFEWDTLSSFYNLNVDSRIKTLNKINSIPHIQFPIRNLDTEYMQYLEPEKITDINQDIIEKTNSLVQGDDDLFQATYKIAEWVKSNIKYDLNTLTETASQKSSWVFQNKEGVCDEITSLFISMARAAGIPARFVTGMVYTNLNNDFGNHGWAEVYFPGYGWVPFDVTFGQYGWIDPSHIKLADNLDAGEPSIKFIWKAYNAEINPSEISLKANVVSIGNAINPILKLQAGTLFDNIGQGSYVPLEVSVENPLNSYISTSLIITKAPELTEENVKQVLLSPYEKKSVFWTVKVPENLENGYVYTSQIQVTDTYGSISETKLHYSKNYKTTSISEANEKIDEINSLNKEQVSEDLSINCKTNSLQYYVNDTARIECKLINLGMETLNSLNVCLEQSCQTLDLSVDEQKMITYNIQLSDTNKKIYGITAKNQDINVESFIKIDVSNSGPLKVYSIETPDEINYDERFTLSFFMASINDLKDLKIQINDFTPLLLEDLVDSREIQFSLKGKSFVEKPLIITITYKDQNNREFRFEKNVNIRVLNVPWYSKLLLLLEKLFSL
ncbi:MAG: transglutaminase-like domain-containing protein [Nanoarchaeota archaeon]|mgnify:CR=1 FL=1